MRRTASLLAFALPFALAVLVAGAADARAGEKSAPAATGDQNVCSGAEGEDAAARPLRLPAWMWWIAGTGDADEQETPRLQSRRVELLGYSVCFTDPAAALLPRWLGGDRDCDLTIPVPSGQRLASTPSTR